VAAAEFERPEKYAVRRPLQIATPAFPTTTIGSFPQTNGVPTERAPCCAVLCCAVLCCAAFPTTTIGSFLQTTGAQIESAFFQCLDARAVSNCDSNIDKPRSGHWVHHTWWCLEEASCPL
jgi:hypothetical protein